VVAASTSPSLAFDNGSTFVAVPPGTNRFAFDFWSVRFCASASSCCCCCSYADASDAYAWASFVWMPTSVGLRSLAFWYEATAAM
jgi:hypothetical protein